MQTTNFVSVARIIGLVICGLLLGVPFAHADSVLWSKTIPGQLWDGYGNLRFVDGSSPALTGHSGHVYMEGTNVSVTYNVRVTDVATGAIVAPGSQVPLSAQLLFEFVPHVYTDISWFSTGSTNGSPYGDWIANAKPPAIACLDKDLMFEGSDKGTVYHYAALSVDPPVKSLFTYPGMTCVPSSGGPSQTCTFTQAGAYTPRFDFAPTSGKFYYRVIEPRFGNNQCAGDNITWMTDDSGQPYTLAVPTQSINFPLTVIDNGPPANPTNSPPSNPGLTSNGACTVGSAHSVTFAATDPDGDQLKYGIDWDGNGSVDEWIPPSGFAPSGSSQSASRTYATSGLKTLKVMAQDQGGLTSGWATVSFSCADSTATVGLDTNPDNSGEGMTTTFTPPAAILNLRAVPSLVRQGDTTNVNWSAQNVTSCTVRGDNADSWTGTQSPIGGKTSKPITGQTLYTLSCTDLQGQTQTKQATVHVLPGFREL